MKKIYTLILAAAAAATALADTWQPIGTGEWYECLLTIYQNVEPGQHWDVEVEESVERPGVYRMMPYAVEGNPIAKIMDGETDTTTEIIINATNPSKVFTVGDFAPYGIVTFSGLNLENAFSAEYYGTLTDGVIYFPEGSFAYYSTENRQWLRFGKDFKVILPGAQPKDYTLKLRTDHICNDGATTPIHMEAGADIATVKASFTRGKYNLADYLEYVAATGSTLQKEDFEINTPKVRGVYSIIAVGLNAAGKIVAGSATYQVCDGENDSDWAEVPNVETTFSEGFLSGCFSDVEPATFSVALQENLKTPGRYRFEAPYESNAEGFPVADHSSAHKHYIYVNASNPARVYVEVSPLGVSVAGWGAAYAYSYPAMYADANVDLSDIDQKYFGSYENGKISAPALLSWNNEPNVGFTDVTFNLEITPKGNDAITEISTEGADSALYNLRGQRVGRPTGRGIYLRGNTKVYVR